MYTEHPSKTMSNFLDNARGLGLVCVRTPLQATSLTVLSRAVVVSAGAIHTPAILLRSGLKHPLIGRHLCLHPVLLVGGVFPEDYRQGDSAEGVVDDSGPISKLSLFSSAYKGDGAGAITGKGVSDEFVSVCFLALGCVAFSFIFVCFVFSSDDPGGKGSALAACQVLRICICLPPFVTTLCLCLFLGCRNM